MGIENVPSNAPSNELTDKVNIICKTVNQISNDLKNLTSLKIEAREEWIALAREADKAIKTTDALLAIFDGGADDGYEAQNKEILTNNKKSLEEYIKNCNGNISRLDKGFGVMDA